MHITTFILVIPLLGIGLWSLSAATWIHSKAAIAQLLLERAWDTKIGDDIEGATRPWPWADTEPIARVIVPRLGIDQIILSNASGRSLAFGPAHLNGTASPGSPGHSIVSGHRDTHFSFLRHLKLGDTLEIVRVDRQKVPYRVIARTIIDSRTALLGDSLGRTVASLVTCYPFDALTSNGPLRYVVTAEAI
ncbi:MAG: class GN sortase [Alphaproteobacteria bacterium]|nr:class GN sortase [Alphaproteobacteria bacterium]HCP00705.1 class GN sortase [Rhodospirillaceae bacterium]